MDTVRKQGAGGLVTALIALAAIPMAAGVVRVISLASGAPIIPDSARFIAMPFPVVAHIVGATLYCLLGAFQFAPSLRRGPWHRLSGRLTFVAGLVAALSGLWMTQYYPLPASLQGPLLYGFRYLIGTAMVVFLLQGLVAILKRNVGSHRAAMARAYAIGQGAGTQALILLPAQLLFGISTDLPRDLLMIAAWLINLLVAEIWLRGQLPSPKKY